MDRSRRMKSAFLATAVIAILMHGVMGCGFSDDAGDGGHFAPGPEVSALFGVKETAGVFDVTISPMGVVIEPASDDDLVRLSGRVTLTGASLSCSFTVANITGSPMRGVVLRFGPLDPAITLSNNNGPNFYNYGDIAAGKAVSRDDIALSGASYVRFRAYVTQKRPPAAAGVVEPGSSAVAASLSSLSAAAKSPGRAASGIVTTQGAGTSLKLDAFANPSISYFQAADQDLRYAWWNGTAWQTVTVDSSGRTGTFSSLALSSLGNPRISYYYGEDSNRNTTGDLRYAFCNSGCDATANWFTVTVDSSGDVGGHTSAALDASGNPRIAYYDFTNGDLKYAFCDGGCENSANWTRVTVDSTGDTGQYASIAVSSGGPKIAYYDATNGDLRYAACNAGCGVTANWTAITVDSTNDVGSFASLALDSSGMPRIGYTYYLNTTNTDVKYAFCNTACATATNWTTVNTTYYDSASVQGYTSIALDITAKPVITYYAFGYMAGEGNLRYSYCDIYCEYFYGWSINYNLAGQRLIDAGTYSSTGAQADVGAFSSLAVSASNDMHAAYYDVTSGDLRYISFKHPVPPDGSTVDQLSSQGTATGYYSSIKADLNDWPQMSYARNDAQSGAAFGNKANNLIRYGYWSGAAWTLATVDSGPVTTTAFWEPQTSFALDSAGRPRIAYVWDKDYIKYAWCDSGCGSSANWSRVTLGSVVSSYQSFIGPSLALDSSGNPRISYWEVDTANVANSRLRYAYCDSGCSSALNWTLADVDTVGNYSVESLYWIGWNSLAGFYYLTGRETSLALTASGGARIAYYDANNYTLKYAACDSGCGAALGWTTVTLAGGTSASEAGRYPSIALDSSGNPRIAYWQRELFTCAGTYYGQFLTYALCDGGCASAANWTTGVKLWQVAGRQPIYCSLYLPYIGEEHGFNNMLVLDAQGRPRIIEYFDTYITATSGPTTYVEKRALRQSFCGAGCAASANWLNLTSNNDWLGSRTSIAIDSHGFSHILWHTVYYGGTLYYVRNSAPY